MATVMKRFGTGYTRTTVVDVGDGEYLWIRLPGPDRAALGRPDPSLRFVHSGPVRLALPQPDTAWAGTGAAVYRVGGQSVAAELLLAGVDDDLAAVLRGAAGALAAVHGTGPAGEPAVPPGPHRLRAWLLSAEGSRAAARLHAVALTTMGRTRADTVVDWCSELVTGRGVPLHGAPGTGRLVVAAGNGEGWLLTGEDLALGPAEADLGWLIGDLVEHRATRPELRCDPLIAAFLAAYPSTVDLRLVGRAAAVRYLTHVHDFASYVGWSDELVSAVRNVAGVIDAAATGTLLPRVRTA